MLENTVPLDDHRINLLISLINWKRFWSKVDLADDSFNCMLWSASKDSSGYGTFHVAGRTLSAHRLGFLHTHKTLPMKGFELHHECITRSCVNGLHMLVVPHETNMYLSRTTSERLPSDQSLQKGACKNGHLMTADNTYVDRRGWSECRTCRQENVRRWRRANSKEVMY